MKSILNFIVIVTALLFSQACTSESSSDADTSNTTLSGSYATLLTINNRLYVVNKTEITTYDITNAKKPALLDKKDIGIDIESLYHYDNLLLIGSANNMYIYELNSNGIPLFKSNSSYTDIFDINGCSSDPIVVKNQIAYVTLSTTISGRCGWRNVNELRVYDIVDPVHPILLDTIGMSNPKGLAIGDNYLYICDGVTGLQVFSLDNPQEPQRFKSFSGFTAYDCILKGNLLLVVCQEELRQYDVSDPNNITLLSQIDL
ncbi:MAG: hypothetical protein H6567_04295 [Lewinellaceae bacterium]|nr:hypothetical protein [Lewinellaceae bacterium]